MKTATAAAGQYQRGDLNKIVNAAAWRAQRTHRYVWGSIYDEIKKVTGIDVREISERKGVPLIDVLEQNNLIDDAARIAIHMYGVRYGQ